MEIYWIFNSDFVRHTRLKVEAINNFNQNRYSYAVAAYLFDGKVTYAEIVLNTFYCFTTKEAIIKRFFTIGKSHSIVPFTIIASRRNFELIPLEE